MQNISLKERLGYYSQLIRLNRPIGIYLVLWPTLWALWVASEGMPDLKILFIFVAGVVLMRSAGCAINDYADRHIDLHVERTKDRPLTSGKITPKEALGVFAVLCLAAFLLVLQLNLNTILLSVVAVVLAATYPFMKRFHSLPQVHLGAAFAWAIPMAFTAINGEAPPLAAWLLFISTMLWTVAYDTFYAMSDRPDDLKIGVKSSAILFGKYDRLVIASLQIVMLITLLTLGIMISMGIFYYAGLVVALGLFAYEHYLAKDLDRTRCLQAFLHNNWVGLSIFAGIAVDYLVSH
jgi:4-hydroxybenzoate polyprenyltransferase